MIAGVPIERLDHVGQAIPVRLLLDNLPLIRDEILLQAFDHALGMLDLLGRRSLELLKVHLIVLDVVKHEEVILLERLEDLQEVLLGEGQRLLGLMCETVLVGFLILGDEEAGGINERLLLLGVRLGRWLILELEDVLHDLLDLLVEQILDVLREGLILGDDELDEIFRQFEVLDLLIVGTHLYIHLFDIVLQLPNLESDLEAAIVSFFGFLLGVGKVKLLLVHVLLEACFVIFKDTDCFTKALMLHDDVFLELLGIFLLRNY